MRIRFFLLLFSLSTIFCCVEWKCADVSNSISSTIKNVIKKKKKKKRKKVKKPKPPKKKKIKTKKKPTSKDTVRAAKKKKRDQKQIDKALNKLDKKKEKKAKKKKKAQDDRKTFDKCDSASVLRTSQDTALLAKYIKIYKSLGGICYIIHLQKMAELEQSAEGFFTVQITKSKDPRAPAAWQTYLYCPIGKPNGTIALINPEGDTIQLCTYLNEKKNGMMYYVQKGKGVVYKEKYVNDIKIWEKKPEED